LGEFPLLAIARTEEERNREVAVIAGGASGHGKNAQKFRLEFQGKIADFIEKQRAAIRRLKASLAVGNSARYDSWSAPAKTNGLKNPIGGLSGPRLKDAPGKRNP
jgi:hypothetical protein